MDLVAAFSPDELTGRSRAHIVELEEPRCSLHRQVVEPFRALRAAALGAGIDLLPVSSFRDFDRQLAIWNDKCRGARPLLDGNGARLDAGAMDEDSLVTAILQWSALPGASRHHWGTDLDVIDAAAMPVGYTPQLVPAEYAPGGVFEHLDEWLATEASAFGFYRPYTQFRGGVQPEPWHLSFAPLATQAVQLLSPATLHDALAVAGLDAWATVQVRLPQIVDQYVLNVDAPDAG
jgi:LAS superfamily LD-carboxypeptidase LdcB